MQAFSKWTQITGDSGFADFVFEVADWLLGYQQDKTGGFINDHQPGAPGYTTAVYLEGIAAALAIAANERSKTYSDSLARGFGFLDRLIIQERDRAILPNLDFALGGLRQERGPGDLVLDFLDELLDARRRGRRLRPLRPRGHGLRRRPPDRRVDPPGAQRGRFTKL